MSQNLRINGVDYNGVESLSIPNTDGDMVQYVEYVPVVVGPTVATIGEVEYDSVEKALAAAVSGETVLVVADTTEGNLVVPEGVILDLNGCAVSANSLLGVDGSDVVDNSADNTGLLKTLKVAVALSKTNSQLPLWNGADGYVLAGIIKFATSLKTNTDGTKTLGFKVYFADIAHQYIANGAETSGATIAAQQTIADGQTFRFVYPDTNVANYANSYNSSTGTYSKMLSCAFDANMLALGEGMTAAVVVCSDVGVEICSDAVALN